MNGNNKVGRPRREKERVDDIVDWCRTTSLQELSWGR